jgi:benzylsuccinate CoA-transferase BbsF subunit
VPNPGHALVALLAAIYERARTGRGRAIELSQFESTVNVVGPAIVAYEATGVVEPRRGNRSQGASPHAVLPAAGDDAWIALVARDDGEFAVLCDVLDSQRRRGSGRDAADRKANEDSERRRRCVGGPRRTDRRALQARGVPASKVRPRAT